MESGTGAADRADGSRQGSQTRTASPGMGSSPGRRHVPIPGTKRRTYLEESRGGGSDDDSGRPRPDRYSATARGLQAIATQT